MAESEALATLRATIKKYLDEIFGFYLTDQHNNFIVQAGGTRVLIIPDDWVEGQTVVKIMALINVNTPVTAELTKYLAAENNKILFGKFSLDSNAPVVLFHHNLLGDFLNRNQFELAVKIVLAVATRYGQEIEKEFGGSKPA